MWTKEQKRKWWQRYYQAHKEEYKQRFDSYRAENKEKVRRATRQSEHRLKVEVLTHYSNSKLACVICGESRLACLSIDHINGGGSQHRRELKKRSQGFYRWLRNENYPEGYQTLCMNCQFIKKIENEEQHRI